MNAFNFVKKNGLNAFEQVVQIQNDYKYVVIYEDELDFTDQPKVKNGAPVFDKEEVGRIVVSHRIVEKRQGLVCCKELLDSVEVEDAEYGSRLGVEYKKSSDQPNDLALMYCDNGESGGWIESRHFNHEMDEEDKFLNITRLRQAVMDVEACQYRKP